MSEKMFTYQVEYINHFTNDVKSFETKSEDKFFELQNTFYDEYSDKGYIMEKTKIMLCEGATCTEKIELRHFTNTCHCGRDYNMNGELLADRDQWGYETGEHWSDCY